MTAPTIHQQILSLTGQLCPSDKRELITILQRELAKTGSTKVTVNQPKTERQIRDEQVRRAREYMVRSYR
jgi:hypothetical protein